MGNPTYISALHRAIEALVKEARDASLSNHPVITGDIREFGLGRLILNYLPDGWDIGRGQIVDHEGNASGQIDLIIYNKKILPPILYNVKEGYYPIEACLYAFEIKSKNSATEVAETVEKFKKFRNLKAIDDRLRRVKRVLFAYDSDLTAKSELTRYTEIDPDYYCWPDVPIICVLGRGYWHFWFNEAKDGPRMSAWHEYPATEDYGELVCLISGIYNTIAHENSKLSKMPGLGSYILPEERIAQVSLQTKYDPTTGKKIQ